MTIVGQIRALLVTHALTSEHEIEERYGLELGRKAWRELVWYYRELGADVNTTLFIEGLQVINNDNSLGKWEVRLRYKQRGGRQWTGIHRDLIGQLEPPPKSEYRRREKVRREQRKQRHYEQWIARTQARMFGVPEVESQGRMAGSIDQGTPTQSAKDLR